MAKHKTIISTEESLFKEVSHLIEHSQQQLVLQANSTLTLLFWHIGKRINESILNNKRGDYGKLIVVTLSRQLSWSHILALLPLKNAESKMYYANAVFTHGLGVRELRKVIAAKEFERTSIANLQNSSNNPAISNNFKDPYFLDFLGLQNTFLEKDLEEAILRELEAFILELGKGFAFIERQKRMIIDGEDFHLDLLFYHRNLRRLIAIELKLGRFEAKHKGQMELYLKWLDRYEKKEGELPPVGLILCAESSRDQVELLEMHKDGIMVAEYWTELPPKKDLERKIHNILIEARERIERKKILQ